MNTRSLIASSLLSLLLLAQSAPVSAQSLLGIIGNSDSLINVGGGQAGDSGLVNLGLGGDDGNILDANIGNAVNANVSAGGGGNALDVNVSLGGGSIGTANVSVGGDGILGVDAGLLNNNVNAQIGVGGDSLATIGIGIGGGGGGDGGGGLPNDGGGLPNPGGGNPGGGNPGGGNGNGNPGGNNGGGGNTSIGFGGGGGNGGFGFTPGCSGPALHDAQRLLRATTVTQRAMAQWQKTSNIQLVPVRFCPETRSQVGQMLSQDPKAQLIQSAARGDHYINAALSRSNVRPENVLTIQNSGSVLRIFVY